jgi:hypothetical protein
VGEVCWIDAGLGPPADTVRYTERYGARVTHSTDEEGIVA